MYAAHHNLFLIPSKSYVIMVCITFVYISFNKSLAMNARSGGWAIYKYICCVLMHQCNIEIKKKIV